MARNIIFDFVEKGDFRQVDFLIKIDPTLVNIRDSTHWTPLHFAARRGHVRVMTVLIDNGAEVEASDDYVPTPLFLWCSCNETTEGAELLLSHGANINSRASKATDTSMTLLHDAISQSNIPIVRFLLSKGADPNIMTSSRRDPTAKTCLAHAVNRNKFEVIELLIHFGANINEIFSDGSTLLHYAAWRDDVDFVRRLVNLGMNMLALNPAYKQLPCAWDYLSADSKSSLSALINWKLRHSYLQFIDGCEMEETNSCVCSCMCMYVYNEDLMREMLSYISHPEIDKTLDN